MTGCGCCPSGHYSHCHAHLHTHAHHHQPQAILPTSTRSRHCQSACDPETRDKTHSVTHRSQLRNTNRPLRLISQAHRARLVTLSLVVVQQLAARDDQPCVTTMQPTISPSFDRLKRCRTASTATSLTLAFLSPTTHLVSRRLRTNPSRPPRVFGNNQPNRRNTSVQNVHDRTAHEITESDCRDNATSTWHPRRQHQLIKQQTSTHTQKFTTNTSISSTEETTRSSIIKNNQRAPKREFSRRHIDE
jgi:hypothetical protein